MLDIILTEIRGGLKLRNTWIWTKNEF